MRRPYVLSVLLIFAAGAQPPSFAQTLTTVAAPLGETGAPATVSAAHALHISAGDLLDVQVFDTPDLSGKLRVDERGKISLPIAGDFAVSGLTAQEASRAIAGKFLSS